MIKKSLFLRIWIYMVVAAVGGIFLFSLFFGQYFSNFFWARQEADLQAEASRLAETIVETTGGIPEVGVSSLPAIIGKNAVIFDSQGRIVAMNWAPGMGFGRHGMMGMGGMGGMFGRSSMLGIQPEWVKQVLAGSPFSIRMAPTPADTSMIVAGAPIKLRESVTGAVFIQSPAAPLERIIGAVRLTLLWTGLLGILLSTLLSYFFSRHLTRPLLAMNQIARRMISGDFSERIHYLPPDEIGELGQTLNSLSGKLTETLAELRREKNELAELLTARKEFLANVAHELRTPLSLIQGYAEALADGVADSKETEREYAAIIAEEGIRLKKMVDELLDLAHLERHDLPLQKERIEIAPLLERIFREVNQAFAEKGVELISQVAPGISHISAQPDRLAQVLLNLLTNALRHSPPGGRVTVTVSPTGKGMIRFTVADTGPGIPAQHLSHVWERFYRVDKARSRSEGGSGLGLAIVKQIVEAHGGKVGVASLEGRGATFWFDLPLEGEI